MLRTSASSLSTSSVEISGVARSRETGRKRPERQTDHHEFRRGPRQQGAVRRRRVAGQIFGVEGRGEGVSFLHAGEAGGCGQGAETGTGLPAEILRKSVMTAALLASVLKKAP